MTPPLEPTAVRPRREGEIRDRLCEALYRAHRRDVDVWLPELERVLGSGADRDPDVRVIRGWLEEQAEVDRRRRERARRVSLKLLLTGAPLVFATLLTGLLTTVLWLSG